MLPARPALLVLAALYAVSCGGGDGRTAFEVERLEPAGLAVPHELGEPVVVTFTRPVDLDSVNATTVFVWHVIGPVEADLAADSSGRAIAVIPTEPLLPGGRYALVVRGELRATDGTALGADVVHTFATVDERQWTPTETVAAGHDRIAQLSIDAFGGYHMLCGEPNANGAWRYFQRSPGGQWLLPEVLPSAPGAPAGFALDLDGSIQGAVASGFPGWTLRREELWQAPVEIQEQPRPQIPPGDPWPNPLLYEWLPGGRVSSALRIGPRFGALCRLVTATQDIACPYEDGAEQVWSAIVGPGNADFALGARVDGGDRAVWAWSPGDAERTSVGPLPDGEVHWAASFGSSAFGEVVAAWLTADALPAVPAQGPYDVWLRAARFDPLVGWAPSSRVLAARTTPEATPFVDCAAAPNGDVLVAFSLDAGPPRGRVLEVAHFVALSDPAGWSVLEIAEHVDDRVGSFAVAQDPNGHAFVAWVESELGVRRLWLQRFDALAGWQQPELVVETATDAVGALHLTAGIDGRVVLAWNQRDAVVARRFE